MTEHTRPPSNVPRSVLSAFLPAVLVAIGVVVAGIYIDRANTREFMSHLKLSVAERLGTVRARLEGNLSANAQLVEGLVAAFSVEPDMAPEKFNALAKPLFSKRSQLRNIGAAPDMVIRYVFPMKGNESAVGLDYRTRPEQREAANRARDTGRLIVAGPVALAQGGVGLIARVPVFLNDAGQDRGRGRFWGLVSAVIDLEWLLWESGLLDDGLPIEVAIRGKDALGAQGDVFFGPPELFQSRPILAMVALPHGSWQMAAIPKGGWPSAAQNAWTLRSVIIIGGLLIVVPVAGIGVLVEGRRRTLDRLRRSRAIQSLAADIARGFLAATQTNEAFSRLLDAIVRITRSEYGFLGRVLEDDDGRPYLLARAISGNAWNDQGRAIPAERGPEQEFRGLDTLFGHAIRTAEVVISNSPATDPLRGGLPAGHPPVRAVLGVPLAYEGRMIGMVGLANRPGGYDTHQVEEMEAVWAATASILRHDQFEETRQAAQRRIRILSRAVEASPSLVLIADRAGKIGYVNPRFSEVTGYEPDEVVGQTPAIMKSGKMGPDEYKELWNTIVGGKVWRGDMCNRKKDGTYYFAAVAIAPILDEKGTVTHFVSVQEDVTEKLQVQNALSESEKRFRDRVESAGDSFHFYSLTPDGAFLYSSPNSADWLGFDPKDIIGKKWRDVVDWTAESIERGMAAVRQCLDRQIPAPVHLEYSLRGKKRSIVSHPHPVADESGRVIRIEGVSVDLTERLELERELREVVEVAKKADRAKSEFLSNMSHELRTPLNAVIGFGQMLEYNPKEPLTPQQQKCVDLILKGGQHLLELINEILDLSKIEAGRLDLSMDDVSVPGLVEECRAFVLPLADRQGIVFDVAPIPPLMVKGDYTRLKQILINLFSNAVKYNRPAGRVDVTCAPRADGTVEIVVADTGLGIPPDQQAELFKPFSRLGREASGIEGTGIGLTITKRLVDLMGGRIACESVVDRGTVFRVVLRGSKATLGPEAAAGAAPPAVADGIDGTVLYVEDNPANLELMEMVMARLDGVRLLTAPTGEIGIDVARDHRPDLIVLDLNLPGLNGFEVLERLRTQEETRTIPVFALTAAATRADIEQGIRAGFEKYLTKPFAVEEVIDAIRGVLEKRGRT